jgi:hypothetical protein
MSDAPPKKNLPTWLLFLASALAPLLVASCSSTPKIQGLPERLPEIALNGSSATPPHTMANYEYPFDANGNYVSNWAAEGERRAGRSPIATDADEKKWSSSHRGHATGKSSPKKSTKKGSGKSGNKSSGVGKSSKKKSSSDSEKPKSKSSSSKKKSSTSKSGGSSKGGSAKKKSSGGGSSDKPKSKSGSGTKSSSSKKKKKAD